MGSIDHGRRSHVAILAFPFGTHAAPLYSLARLLAAASPDTFFSFLGSAKSNAPLERTYPAPDNLRLYAVSDGAPEGFVPSPGNPEEEIDYFLKVTPGNFMEGMEVAVRDGDGAGGVRVSSIVGDSFLWFAGKVAEEMGVPWVALWTGGPCSLSSHVYTDAIREAIGVGDQAIPEKADHSLDFVPGLSALRVRDLPEGVVFGNLNSLFARLLHRMGQEMPHATAVALNTFEGLEPGVVADLNTKFHKCLPVGPLNRLAATLPQKQAESDRFGCLSWLENQLPGSVAYIGFGTVMCPLPTELAALAEGLEESGVPFLWSLKEKMWGVLPKGFLDRTSGRGLVVPWAPQVEILGHSAVGVFMTHCGWNSVTESISGGVPMLCRPFFGDQRLNAREASHMWEIGLVVENGLLTKEWVMSALNTVLRTEEGKKMKERAGAIKELAKKAVGRGGSSVGNFDALVEVICGRRGLK